MTELQFSLPLSFSGRFVTDEDTEIGLKERLLLQAYVPGIGFFSHADQFDITVYHKESDDKKMVMEGNEITIYGRWQGEVSPDLYHLLYGIARQHYLRNNLFPVHAACVGLDGLILITGHSGSGKTTVSLELVEKTGMRMYSGNKTVVSFTEDGTLEAIAGTKAMTIRTEDLKLQVQGVHNGERTAFKLNDQQYAQAGNISSVVLVRLNDGRQDWRKLQPTSALHMLYPFFLDTVNADVIMGNDIFEGSVPKETKEYLTRRLAKTVERVQVYSAVGPLSFIVDALGRQNENTLRH